MEKRRMNADFQRRVKNTIQLDPEELAQKKKFMELALEEGRKAMNSGAGGPFGAVIVRNNEVVSCGYNMVFETLDPTAHAEIVAIRNATQKLGQLDLSDCELFTTCEPCPQCLAATYWAGISRIYYGITQEENVKMGFPGAKRMYEAFEKHGSAKQVVVFAYEDICQKLMAEWLKKDAQEKQYY